MICNSSSVVSPAADMVVSDQRPRLAAEGGVVLFAEHLLGALRCEAADLGGCLGTREPQIMDAPTLLRSL